jgi:DNA repair protein RadA/Sms
MAKTRSIYECQNCGAQSPRWVGRCPECQKWNTYVEEAPQVEAKRSPLPENNSKPTPLSKVRSDEGVHIPVGIGELDRVLGGGYIPGCLALIGGDPGIGKSTIITQMLAKLTKQNKKILYVSAEESASQIKLRAERLKICSDEFIVLTENCLERIIEHTTKSQPDVLVIDSIQTVYTNDIQSAPGTVSQVRECGGKLMSLAKSSGISTFLIGHVTKDGSIAGPKVLEHMVDTVLYFEGERGHQYRILRTIKNRFGATNEIGVFEMTGDGLKEVTDPSGIFLAERAENAAGSAVVSVLEGSRPVLMEVQALVSSSGFGNPRRTSLGIDNNRTNLLIAVLEKIVGLQLGDQDIFVNVAGGIKISEPSSDLGVIAAIHSSFTNQAIDSRIVFLGEVGLTGEIRNAMGTDTRLKEAAKLGFTKAIVPKAALKNKLPRKIEIEGISKVEECFDLLSGCKASPF